MTLAEAAALAYFVASRLTYVLFVGIALRLEERRQAYTGRHGVDEGFRRFRRTAATVMNHDAAAFVALCVLSRGTLALEASPPRAAVLVLGAVLVVLGVAVKLWAAATLGAKAYYWYDFFAPGSPHATPKLAGPYRFLANPMYTVGYLPAYGLALLTGSWPGLLGAAFAQAAILAFYRLVEKPHFERLRRRA